MKIELVNVNGRLIGRTFQDRWNLETLELSNMAHDRNNSVVKKARRANPDFTFTIVRSVAVSATRIEQAMFFRNVA